MGISQSRPDTTLSFLVYLGVIDIIKKENINKKFFELTRRNIGNLNVNSIYFYAIPKYDDEHLLLMNKRLNIFYENKLRLRRWSREMIYRALGEEEANRVYPSMKGIELSDVSKDSSSKIETVALKIIHKKGWVTERELEKNVMLKFGGKEFKRKQIKKLLGEMVNKYDLKRVRLNKDLKRELNVNMDGYPFLIMLNK